ncbi:hypothetical protein QQP08_013306 [Theobroma cacao]|nr:hypothetical protein QQP08_012993 [Theobroma cacao]WRX20819.1 hypothetical protein QQP08_013306 [Theobroma cacao]
MANAQLQKYGMLSREQLVYLFDRFSVLVSQRDVKKRIVEAVDDKQEPVAVTTAIQEEIFLEMGVGKEELACDEAELGPEEFAEKLDIQQKLQEQQLEMLKYMRKFHLDDQSAILEKLHNQMEDANFDSEASILSSEKIQEIVRRRVSPLFRPSGLTD